MRSLILHTMKEHSTDPETLLERVKAGDADAADDLFRRIYSELHGIATGMMAGRPRDSTLQTTAIVNEALMKILSYDQNKWPNCEKDLILLGARAMKQVLIDHARKRLRKKRTLSGKRLLLDELVDAYERDSKDLILLGMALDDLEKQDPVAARLVHLRFFAGMSLEQAARILGIPKRTAERDWRAARAWLKREMQ